MTKCMLDDQVLSKEPRPVTIPNKMMHLFAYNANSK